MTKVHSTLDKMIVQMSKIERRFILKGVAKSGWIYYRYTADYPSNAGLFSHYQ